tara:strand:- start:4514 stop:4699 length:186 start_codon:yes stop_codon:yes gene_type:complete
MLAPQATVLTRRVSKAATHRPRIRQNPDLNHIEHLNPGEPSDIMYQVGKVLPGLKLFDDLL